MNGYDKAIRSSNVTVLVTTIISFGILWLGAQILNNLFPGWGWLIWAIAIFSSIFVLSAQFFTASAFSNKKGFIDVFAHYDRFRNLSDPSILKVIRAFSSVCERAKVDPRSFKLFINEETNPNA